MRKKLTRHGNSLALVIDKPILDLLHADAETTFEISTDGKAMVISPVKDAKCRKKFQKALEETNDQFGSALKRLAG